MGSSVSRTSTERLSTLAESQTPGLSREADAIAGFLKKNWDVKVDKGSLRLMVVFLLEEGALLGERFGKDRFRKEMAVANRMIEIINLTQGTHLPQLSFPLNAPPPEDFGEAAERLEKQVETRFKVSAQPKAAEHWATQPVQFNGTDLHSSIGATTLDFAEP